MKNSQLIAVPVAPLHYSTESIAQQAIKPMAKWPNHFFSALRNMEKSKEAENA